MTFFDSNQGQLIDELNQSLTFDAVKILKSSKSTNFVGLELADIRS